MTVVFLEDRDELSLLKFDGKDGPVFFVVKGLAKAHASDEEMQSSAAYFYEEHSCPTNWLRDCVAVIENGGDDPHGFLEHVRTVQVSNALEPEDFKRESWQELFPEAFGDVEIDGQATNVTDQKSLPAPPDTEGEGT